MKFTRLGVGYLELVSVGLCSGFGVNLGDLDGLRCYGLAVNGSLRVCWLKQAEE